MPSKHELTHIDRAHERFLSRQVNSAEKFPDAANSVARQLMAFTYRWYGERCDEYEPEPECACCKAWRIVDAFCDLNKIR
jgi:hypothetical protein